MIKLGKRELRCNAYNAYVGSLCKSPIVQISKSSRASKCIDVYKDHNRGKCGWSKAESFREEQMVLINELETFPLLPITP